MTATRQWFCAENLAGSARCSDGQTARKSPVSEVPLSLPTNETVTRQWFCAENLANATRFSAGCNDCSGCTHQAGVDGGTADCGPLAQSIISAMATAKPLSDEELIKRFRPSDEELYRRFRMDKDHAAFERLYQRYSPPSGDLLDGDGQNLVDWVQCEKGINGFDADDIVADCWADLIVNQPDINESFKAFTYQKLEWLVADYWEKRRWPKRRKLPESQDSPEQKEKPEEKFWLMPWRARSNYTSPFAPLDEKPSRTILRAEETAALQDDRIRARQLTYFLDLAIMQEAITRLSLEEQHTILLYWFKALTLTEAAKAAGTTFWQFRKRNERALKRLCNEFFDIRYKTETLEDRTKLLKQWGDVRPDLHWVPDDENEECDCPTCEKTRREIALSREGANLLSPSEIRSFLAAHGVDPNDMESVKHFLGLGSPTITRWEVGTLSA